MFHHKRGLKFQNIIFPRTLYWQGHPASHLPWLRPDARGRLWQPSEDDQLLADDESNEAGGAVAVALGTGDHLHVPSSGITGTLANKTMRWKYFFLKQERLWKLGVLSWGSSLWSPSHHRTPGFNSSELSSQKSFLVKMITNQVRIPRRHWRNLRWVIFHIIKYSY